MCQLIITIPGTPIAQPRHKISGKHRYLQGPKDKITGKHLPHPVIAYKELIGIFTKQAMKEFGMSIIMKPDAVDMDITFILERPAGNKWSFHTSTPDCDNLTKGVQDALEGILYENDSQIYTNQPIKLYGTPARTIIEIEFFENYKI